MTLAIKVENISKSFPMKSDQPRFKEFLVNFHKYMKKDKSSFWALKDVSFSVTKGECVGIIGKNGAGKSTMLSLLLGTILPTKGQIVMKGNKTPLLELGAGFHPDLSGIENIIFNGVLLGMSRKEVMDRMDKIIDFAELDEFIKMPARTYSSGMYMRLAFSVAIHTDPEILLIDEILAVGDESFQKKSRAAIMNLIKRGVTTIFVSHNLEMVKQICNRVVWLHKGEIKDIGTSDKIVDEYLVCSK